MIAIVTHVARVSEPIIEAVMAVAITVAALYALLGGL